MESLQSLRSIWKVYILVYFEKTILFVVRAFINFLRSIGEANDVSHNMTMLKGEYRII